MDAKGDGRWDSGDEKAQWHGARYARRSAAAPAERRDAPGASALLASYLADSESEDESVSSDGGASTSSDDVQGFDALRRVRADGKRQAAERRGGVQARVRTSLGGGAGEAPAARDRGEPCAGTLDGAPARACGRSTWEMVDRRRERGAAEDLDRQFSAASAAARDGSSRLQPPFRASPGRAPRSPRFRRELSFDGGETEEDEAGGREGGVGRHSDATASDRGTVDDAAPHRAAGSGKTAPPPAQRREEEGAAAASPGWPMPGQAKEGRLGASGAGALLDPLPREGSGLQCFVIRDRRGSRQLRPLYRVYVEATNGSADPVFLMAGQKRMKSATSYYAVSRNASSAKAAPLVGKVRSNWSGSEYSIYGGGEGGGPEGARGAGRRRWRREVGAVMFGYDAMGPGRIRVLLPRVDESGAAATFRPGPRGEGLQEAAKARAEDVVELVNMRPKWDPAHGGHVLNFKGRVTSSSVKNFQLCCPELSDAPVLQFGRVGRERFSLDFSYPLSPYQAFAIVLASLDGKLTDSRSFDALRKLSQAGGEGEEPGADTGNVPNGEAANFRA